MDTERMFIDRDASESVQLQYEELKPEELDTVRRYVEMTRHLQEIQNLYLMFQFNLDSFLGHYTLMNSGSVLRGSEPATSEEDYIAINAYTSNLISSGRTLVESMECYMKENYPEGADARKDYLDFYHGAYDGSFAYRLLIRMRDFAQHGHLPVNLEGEHYCINLYSLARKPHYNHNAAIKRQIDAAVEEIIEVYRDTPTLSLALTLAEFTAQLLSVYEKFWACAEAELTAVEAQTRKVIQDNPQNINFAGEAAPGFFVYGVTDGMAQLFYIGDDAKGMFRDNYEEAAAAHRKYEEEWNSLREGMLTIQVTKDRKQIELGGL